MIAGRAYVSSDNMCIHDVFFIIQVFGEDFTLCLLLGDFLADPIFSQSEDFRVAVYGEGDHFRSRSLSSMILQVAEGHILGQVSIYL